MKLIITSLIFYLYSISIFGQHTMKLEGKSPKASIEDVSWIAGHWQGEAFGGITEEVWTEPLGGSMMGSFKLVSGDKVNFYELCIIREVEETIILQLKHFHGDLKGWEEQDETVDFPLVKVDGETVYFDQFTFQKINKNEMHIHVVISDGDEEKEVPFKYFRK